MEERKYWSIALKVGPPLFYEVVKTIFDLLEMLTCISVVREDVSSIQFNGKKTIIQSMTNNVTKLSLFISNREFSLKSSFCHFGENSR